MNTFNDNIVATPVQQVELNHKCDFCGNGLLISLNSHDDNGLIRHRCNRCGKIVPLDRSYPYISYIATPTMKDYIKSMIGVLRNYKDEVLDLLHELVDTDIPDQKAPPITGLNVDAVDRSELMV